VGIQLPAEHSFVIPAIRTTLPCEYLTLSAKHALPLTAACANRKSPPPKGTIVITAVSATGSSRRIRGSELFGR
jgi:hypothetical protein